MVSRKILKDVLGQSSTQASYCKAGGSRLAERNWRSVLSSSEPKPILWCRNTFSQIIDSPTVSSFSSKSRSINVHWTREKRNCSFFPARPSKSPFTSKVLPVIGAFTHQSNYQWNKPLQANDARSPTLIPSTSFQSLAIHFSKNTNAFRIFFGTARKAVHHGSIDVDDFSMRCAAHLGEC